MKTILIIIVGTILAVNAAVAFVSKNYHATIGWCGFLICFIWLSVELGKEKVVITFEFENEKK